MPNDDAPAPSAPRAETLLARARSWLKRRAAETKADAEADSSTVRPAAASTLARLAEAIGEAEVSLAPLEGEPPPPGPSRAGAERYEILERIGEGGMGEVYRLGPREVFGELALLDPEPRSASVEAVEPTRLFRLDRETFFELMASHIEVVGGIVQVLARRLRRMTTIAMEGP